MARLFTRGAIESTSELRDAVDAVRRRTWKTFEVAMALNSSYDRLGVISSWECHSYILGLGLTFVST